MKKKNGNGKVGAGADAENGKNGADRLTSGLCDCEIVTITRKLVDSLLECNENNRKLNKSNLARITDDVRRGEYVFNGQPIIRDDHGRLLDGQHRLKAFQACGYPPVKVLLVTIHGDGRATTDAYLHMDSGVSRQFRVFLQHQGIQDAIKIQALCKKLSYMENDFGSLAGRTDTYMRKVYMMYRREIEVFAPMLRKIKGFNANMGAAACAIAKVTGCANEIADLVRRAALGDMLKIGTPAHTLAKIINQGRTIDCRGTGFDQFSFAVVAHAIIAELNMEPYPVMNKNIKKACEWIREMARSNGVPILPGDWIDEEKVAMAYGIAEKDGVRKGA